MAQWLSWLERRPVTAEVTSSSLVWVDIVSRRGPRVAWDLFLEICRRGGIGRRPGLKIPWVVIPVPVRPRPAALDKGTCADRAGAFIYLANSIILRPLAVLLPINLANSIVFRLFAACLPTNLVGKRHKMTELVLLPQFPDQSTWLRELNWARNRKFPLLRPR